ncbi:LytTR family DNA-binding domain-containing protein [Rhodoferax sp.]|jgi:two-component system response regulator AlgR|uniref:LytR/AlgR family response regulator transcription factor n=1 Tax=Rhodoferax sp. TaxID=50421 RepID=UPI00271DA1C9|nr:LytTR family DNA-binding domain-containing protein [Rhodoferax sp.]MDO9142953.1 LytTR family DNA-binding domain-containing protein [Rhodoferax sp.]MDP3193117.1 LytTR family DNA-binding domain-containing protein [Rhodoferax sp.]MDP3336110.1 LytTR family DNA-binding domain-containing protein [Rhodoferax sp.]MDP3865835.1 LytTR family DNA-binding domain-containing protein [Rhodoferax sp.]
MMIRVLVVDDEGLARSRLKTLLGDCREPQAQVLGEAANAVQAMDFLQHHAVDAVLADIHMPGADGLMLARALRQLPHPPAVVFVTAFAEHAVQAFELEALDYLTKPVRLERLQAALQKIERARHQAADAATEAQEDVLVIQERGRAERVPLAQVLYLKAELKYITVRTASRSYLLETSLFELEARYGSRFIRIHRNALVARRAVRALEKHLDPEEGEGWAVRLDGVEDALFVSRRQLSAVRALVSAV